MGVTGRKDLVEFTAAHVANRELVISMLKYEEELTKSERGQALYANPLNRPLVTLFVEHTLNRMTLAHFGFATTDTSVETYRTIFGTYYRSPFDYDAEVLNSVHYMRENKCVYYKSKPLTIGSKIPNCPLYTLSGEKTTLFDQIATVKAEAILVAAFSLS